MWTDNTRNAKIKGDQIEVFKILNGYENIDSNIFFEIKESKITRGHNYTLVKKQSRLDVRKFSFSQRTINIWNNLSTDSDTYFLTHTRVSSAARAACPNPTCGPPLVGACVLRQSATRTSFQSSQLAKFLEIVNNRRLFCRVVELPYIVDFFITM